MANRFLNNITINDEYTLPPTDGTANQVIKTDGAGNLSFVDATALVTTAESGLVYYDVKNSTGGAINKGKAVRAVGTDGNSGHILIDEMIADGSVESKYFMGILETTLNNGDIGRVIHFGEIDQFNTLGQNGETWNDGDLLWLDPSNNGDYTITEPNGPNIKVAAAIVVNAATNGKIFTRVQANEGVHDLHDVLIQSVATGHILVYDATTDVWKNSSQSTDAALMPSGTEAQRPTPTAGMIRFNTTANEFEGYNGTEWAPIGGTGSASIDIDNFTGNSSEVNFILSSEIQEEDNTQVYIDGVYQSKSNYTTSGTTLTFSTPPPTGTSIEVVNFTSIAESQIDGTGTTNYIAKWTDADTLANSVIQDDGTNVGIGCTPTSISGYTVLDINNSTNGAIIDLSQADAMKGRLIATSSSMAIETASGIPISFQPSGTERMRIASNGAVGINGDNYLYAFPSTSNTGFIGSGFSLNGASNSMQLWTNNTERLRITSSGNVGIGTTSPSFKLQVNGDFAAEDNIYLTDAGTVRGKFELNASDRDDVDIKAVSLGSNMKFFTVDSERMRIDSSGNVQIGSGTRFGKFDILNIGGSGSNFIIDAGGDNYYTSGASGVQVFRTGSTERMRIDSSGNVAINDSTNANISLTVTSKSGYEDIAYFKSSGTNIDARINLFPTGTGNGAINSASNSLELQTAGSPKMTIDSSGNVGIGTTSPATKLHISDAAVTLTTTSTNGVSGFIHNVIGGATALYRLQNNYSEVMRINPNGNVGIGTTSPSAKFHTNCSSYPETTEKLAQFNAGVANYQSNRYVELSNSFTGAGYTSPALVFKTNANSSNQKSYGLIATLADGSLSFQNKPAGSEIAIGTSLGTQEKMRITSSGDLHVEGDVIAASTTVSSDENLKKDISTYEDALQTISELNGVSFTWKSNDKKSVGVIAQDVQKVLPELVGTKKSLEGGEETLTVDYNGLIGVLIQAVKELSKQVEELKN